MTDSHSRPQRPRASSARPATSATGRTSARPTRSADASRAVPARAPARRTIRIALPDGWARAGLAGVEAALIGWGLVMLLTLVGYLGVSSNAWLGKATWAQAMGAGGDAWAAALGTPVTVDGVSYRAVPTLMTLLVIALLRILLLTGRGFPAAAQWMAVPTFAVTSMGLVAATADHVAWFRAAPGALTVAVLACAWAVVAQSGWRPSWAARAPWAAGGLAQVRGAVAALALVGLAALAVSAWASRAEMAGIHQILLASTTDTVVTVIVQALFIPTGAAWALSWLSGAGFWVGVDALHTPTSAPVAPIPAIPLLGAVPSTAPGTWVVVVPVLVGVVLGVWVRWRHRAADLPTQVWAGLVSAVGVAAVVAAWFWLSTLRLGVDRMAVLGPRVLAGTGLVVLEVVVVAQVVAVAAHPVSVAWARRVIGSWFSRDEGVPAPADREPPGTAERAPDNGADHGTDAGRGRGTDAGGDRAPEHVSGEDSDGRSTPQATRVSAEDPETADGPPTGTHAPEGGSSAESDAATRPSASQARHLEHEAAPAGAMQADGVPTEAMGVAVSEERTGDALVDGEDDGETTETRTPGAPRDSDDHSQEVP